MDSDYEIKRILGEEDLYKILEVSKNALEPEIKEKYRKLAKIVHPDRCHNEKSTEAFQKIVHAYQVLTDPEKRHVYDLYGDNPQHPQQRYAYREEDLPPDDIFSFFFGVPTGPRKRAQAQQARNNRYYEYPGNAGRYQQRNQNQQNQQDGDFSLIIMRILPFFFFVFLLISSSGVLDLSNISLLFSNPASRKNLKGVIRFEEKDLSGYQCLKTKKYHANYCIPDWWINSQRRDLRRKIFQDVNSIADDLYEEELKIRCELEKNLLNNKEGKKCKFAQRVLKKSDSK